MHGCATAKVGPDANASPRCNCREAIHTFSRRASVYALGSDMKIDEGTFPNSSVGDCFLPSPLHNFLLRPFSCCLPVNMHAGFLIRPLLDTNPPSSTIEDVLRKSLVLTYTTGSMWWPVGYWGMSGQGEKVDFAVKNVPSV